ncbi:Similar to ATP-binding cassette sub-family F member 3; acc. no. Q66H39 [Pyronema omphalodes CBS 100304]|uniref:Similar to ATP-binding cassette sub-family F member 3 acc. no. Q66H39 n=1 Tax=Pyronema omphalodes (strain CBS 100304) TaxID=1076935 RepID=U4LC06_PYROM|nr:Similar to ATP-binding cassette sub-family F member 3; acc. no. Q66H39 [Pyronema omphalodes CBS 100304]
MPRKPAPNSSSSVPAEPALVVTSQQSRFHTASEASESFTTKDLDIQTLNIAIGNKEILVDATLKLQYGVRYALVGRNGVGKSTLLKAIGEKLIPDIPANLKILLLGQTETLEDTRVGETVVEYVVRSDKEREKAMRESELLTTALESSDPLAACRAMRNLKFQRQLEELEDRKKKAARRSGAKGWNARKELRKIEEEVAAASAELEDETGFTEEFIADTAHEASQILEDLTTTLDSISAATASNRARTILLNLGFSEAQLTSPLSSLSGGWRTRLRLATTLFQPAHYLLLDEPTNYLDLPSLLWLQSHLQSLSCTLILITHDITFSNAIASEILILRDQKLEHFHGNLSSWQDARRDEQLRLGRMKSAQEKQAAHIKQTIQGNIRAARSSGDDKKLKQAASRQKKLDERMGMEVSAKGGRFKLNRDLAGYHLTNRAEIEIPQDEAAVKLRIPGEVGELRGGGALVAFEGVGFRYKGKNGGQDKQVLEGITFSIHPGGRMGIIGVNGAGKTTLLKLLVGRKMAPGVRSGGITLHPKVRMGYFSQSAVEELQTLGEKDKEATSLSLIMAGSEMSEQEARALLGGLGLQGRVASEVPLALLSGGQKVRLALGMVLRDAPHLLVLDEVTTHLDADSIVALAGEMNKFSGAVLVVSHDRFFVRAVVEGVNPAEDQEDEDGQGSGWDEEKKGAVWVLEKGKLKVVEGGTEEWERKIEKRLAKMGI